MFQLLETLCDLLWVSLVHIGARLVMEAPVGVGWCRSPAGEGNRLLRPGQNHVGSTSGGDRCIFYKLQKFPVCSRQTF